MWRGREVLLLPTLWSSPWRLARIWIEVAHGEEGLLHKAHTAWRPRASQSMEIRAGSVWRRGEPLTLRTFLHVFLSVIEHLGPIVPLVDCGLGTFLLLGSQSHHHGSLASPSSLPPARDTLGMDHSVVWNMISCIEVLAQGYNHQFLFMRYWSSSSVFKFFRIQEDLVFILP